MFISKTCFTFSMTSFTGGLVLYFVLNFAKLVFTCKTGFTLDNPIDHSYISCLLSGETYFIECKTCLQVLRIDGFNILSSFIAL